MSVHIMYYGMLAEITGQSSEAMVIHDLFTVGNLRNQILEKYPMLRDKKFKIAVNKQIVEDFVSVSDQAEIALLPPFAGG